MTKEKPGCPDIYLFNPSCDFAVGNGSPSWQPGKLIRTMEHDLGNLPQFLGKSGDIVLTSGMPSPRLCDWLANAGFPVPQFLHFNTYSRIIPAVEESAGWLRPWGWSPAAHQHLKAFKPFCSGKFLESPMAQWNPLHRDLFSRNTAAAALRLILEESGYPLFLDKKAQPRICTTLSGIETLADHWGKLMIKMPWSSSGRGLQPITRFPLHPSIARRISGMLKSQGYILAEPLHRKAADLAFLYDISGDRISFTGYSRFFTDDKGQYKGNYLNGWPGSFPDEVKSFAAMAESLLPEIHIRILKKLNVSELYSGPLGIDVLIYRDNNNHLRINPCQEINWRYTMGNIALHLEKSLHRLSSGIFGIYYDPQVSFKEMTGRLLSTHPPLLKEGRIYSGYVPLTEFSAENLFGAYIRISSAD